MLLNNKSALITGASRGIGKAIAEEFAKNGIEHLILFARDIDKLNKLKEEFSAKYSTNVHVFELNIRDTERIKLLSKEIRTQKIPIDIIVNNAGVLADAVIKMVSENMVKEIYETNVYGSIYITQNFLSDMIKKRYGSIINLSSIIGVHGNVGQSIYGSSKSAIIGFTKSLSKELAPLGIRVNAIAPGFIETDMIKAVNETTYQKIFANIGMKKLGKPEDVAKVALFLASDMSDYVTGQIIGVDGGMIV
jgi:3-oxoacyl-[acyl-carrier protein] reductase